MQASQTKWMWLTVALLLLVQSVQMALVVHRESLTFDEDNHMFAGYMMAHTGDYGLNPEHPPLVKLLATVPLIGRDLWVPPLKGRDFKAESYLDGRDWLARNDGDRQQLVFQMRLTAGLLAIALTLVIFLATRAWLAPASASWPWPSPSLNPISSPTPPWSPRTWASRSSFSSASICSTAT